MECFVSDVWFIAFNDNTPDIIHEISQSYTSFKCFAVNDREWVGGGRST